MASRGRRGGEEFDNRQPAHALPLQQASDKICEPSATTVLNESFGMSDGEQSAQDVVCLAETHAPRNVITFGTFDLFHIGHLNILRRAAKLGSRLIVGVSSDALSFDKKGYYPVYGERDRMEIVGSLEIVDEVFREDSLELKGNYIKRFSASVLVMGDDWEGKFDEFRSLCEVKYLPRTPLISTTQLRRAIASREA